MPRRAPSPPPPWWLAVSFPRVYPRFARFFLGYQTKRNPRKQEKTPRNKGNKQEIRISKSAETAQLVGKPGYKTGMGKPQPPLSESRISGVLYFFFSILFSKVGLLFFFVGYFFLTFFLLSLTFERQEKAGKDRKRSKKERAREKAGIAPPARPRRACEGACPPNTCVALPHPPLSPAVCLHARCPTRDCA